MCCTFSRKLYGLYGKVNGILVARDLRMLVAFSGHSAITAEQFVMCNTTRRNDEPINNSANSLSLISNLS